ncbi:hypothetical protein GCM10010309_19310 [Streptomyces violaceochromogenes]|nr:hypothetical protein GCM10010309_19310 [Streptomyces violaceochromogenes]
MRREARDRRGTTAPPKAARGARLRGLAAPWEAGYGGWRRYGRRQGHLHHGTGPAAVYSVAPHTVFGFGEGEPFSRLQSVSARVSRTR